MRTIERERYLNRLIDRKENGMIKVITGIRRCGKSFLLFRLFFAHLLQQGVREDHIIRVALDDDDNRELRNPDVLSAYLHDRIADDGEMYYVLLDEVQFAISEEELRHNGPIRIYGILNGLLQRANADVYITGSNSRFLSSDIMTEFRGRGDEVRVYPFSFSEFYSARGGDKYEAFTEYLTFGGMPIVLSQKREADKSGYLRDAMKETYLKDVVERNRLQGSEVMNRLVEVLASAIGSLTNPLKLANSFDSSGLKVSDVTVSNYVHYLEDAFLLQKAERYDVKGKKYISTPYKYYFTDVGLRNAVLNFRQQEPTHLMENIIYNELLMRGYSVDVGIVTYTDQKEDGKRTTVRSEVDFVCNLGSQRYYIQSAFSIPTQEKMAQETASLDRIGDSFKKIIIVGDMIRPWRNEKGYLIMSIYDFLLNSDSLEM